MMDTGTVFVVENDLDAVRRISRVLVPAGFDIRTFASAEAFLEQRPLPPPACVVINQGLSGLDLQERLADERALSIVFVTGRRDIPAIVKAMKRGAVDVLPKPIEAGPLLSAVKRGLEQSARIARELKERAGFVRRLHRLTPREHEVVAGVLRGLLNKQIAFEMAITEKTVKVHRSHAMAKLEVGSVAELARTVEETGTVILPAGT